MVALQSGSHVDDRLGLDLDEEVGVASAETSSMDAVGRKVREDLTMGSACAPPTEMSVTNIRCGPRRPMLPGFGQGSGQENT